MRRHSVNASRDRRAFSRTADRTKTVNTGLIVPRGGIRL